MRITTDGVVLGTANMEETDRLVTVLSDTLGVVRAWAKGARRPGSKLSASTELLCYSRFVLFKHKERYSVDAADSNTLFFHIRGDFDKLALASYLCELSANTSPAEAPAGAQQRLLLNCLHMLETDKRTPAFIKPLYELRQIALAGYMPNLVGCSECGAFEGERFYLDPLSGEIRCAACGAKPAAPCELLVPSILAAMRHILYADDQKLFAFTLPPDQLQRLGEITERFIQAQLARTFRSLEFYNTLGLGT